MESPGGRDGRGAGRWEGVEVVWHFEKVVFEGLSGECLPLRTNEGIESRWVRE